MKENCICIYMSKSVGYERRRFVLFVVFYLSIDSAAAAAFVFWIAFLDNREKGEGKKGGRNGRKEESKTDERRRQEWMCKKER